ncbi:hypothetical protein [Streptomyces sp. NPDC002580]|uniref:hypothetical protein n=1 Tax=Streptomyces sp. NPDC002580 TaxID=3364653 RepID=UPI0036B92599
MAGTTEASTDAGRSRTEVVASGEGAVFVDESGRRRSWVRGMGWLVTVSCVCFATALTALVSGGDAAAPWLSLPDRAHKAHGGSSAVGPAPGADRPAPRTPSPSPTTGAAASTDPRELPDGRAEFPTDEPAAGRSVGATGAGDGKRPRHRDEPSSPAPAPSASGRAGATPSHTTPAAPAGEASGTPSATPSVTAGETPEPTAPDPSDGATAGALSARVPIALLPVPA